jgi:hypothetical protein
LLLWYKTQKDFETSPSLPKGQLLLAPILAGGGPNPNSRVTISWNKQVFTLHVGGDRDLVIQANSDDEAKEWVKGINTFLVHHA